ncbi:PLP-dependent aminotransferase family protein [Epibacterium ulvae]|uniref:aminotransferase-like domain-containing protein n=1 Tax=Epibacterium ulvae TaxID=1156985 RepID=UPI00203E69DF|nr:PLP-dependent aminotransferase family protein [Epibacterium ulvae]
MRRALISAIATGQLAPGQKVQSTRMFADKLGIARNTVAAVFEELAMRGYLEAKPRRGYYISTDLPTGKPQSEAASELDWNSRLLHHPSQLNHIRKPLNWQDYKYPFAYGQVDPSLFPLNAWRASSRDMLGRAAVSWWGADRAIDDDPMLIKQIQTQILPDRGIYARPEEIIVTLGAQEGLYLISQLLAGPGKRVGCEVPGYPDSSFIFDLSGSEVTPLAIDKQGAVIPPNSGLDLAVLTPGAHCPSMTVMSGKRRDQVLNAARQDDFLVVEDDYEGDVSFVKDLALKSRDKDGRVLYLGTLSKILAPGVRLGYLVAPEPVIQEARWLRRLIHRSAPLNNQRAAAIFLAEGHYHALVRKLRTSHQDRWERVMENLPKLMPGFRTPDPCHCGRSVWLECPDGVDARDLFTAAGKAGITFESGDPFVPPDQAGRFLRLGLSVINTDLIVPGMKKLGEIADNLAA